jgi:hypothetical protein
LYDLPEIQGLTCSSAFRPDASIERTPAGSPGEAERVPPRSCFMEIDDTLKFKHLLSNDGRIRRWPKKEVEKHFVLEFMRSKFIEGKKYTESEVNDTLTEWHAFNDHALLRREMFEHGLINRTRDGRAYWT